MRGTASLVVIGDTHLAPGPRQADKLAALLVEDINGRTIAIDALLDAVEASVKAGGGAVRRLGNNQRDLSMDEPWVGEAFAVWAAGPKTTPWIVAANPGAGVNQSLPAEPAAAVAIVKSLGGK